MLSAATWTLILSGWSPGTLAACTRVHVVSRSDYGVTVVNAAVVPTSDCARTRWDTTENTENGLDTIRMITTDSPRLTVTSGECYVSDVITQIRRDLRHTHDNSAAVNCNAGELNDLIFRRVYGATGGLGRALDL